MIRLHLLGALELAAPDGRDVRPLLAQPKRLAVLAYLAARPAGEFVRRDVLLGAFWPEMDQAAARRSLRQTLHVLRTHLGVDALPNRGDEEVAINTGVIACDVPQFLASIAEGRPAEALDLYQGELLAGFFLSGAGVTFERWLEGERARLNGLALRAAATLAESAERAGDGAAAAAWARRALALAPDDEIALRRLLTLLDAAGDRAGALRAYDAFARRLGQDLGEQPSEETRRLAERLRGPTPAAGGTVPTPAPAPPPQPRRSSRRGWMLLAGAAGAVAVAGIGAALYARRTAPPVLAVGSVTGGDAAVANLDVRALPELLATDLARVGGLAVVSHPRLEAVAGELAAAGRPATPTDAARAAGATELLEGVLYRLNGSLLRLDLRRVDARRGVVREAVTLTGSDVFQLADSAAARYATRFGRRAPSPGLATVTSPSLVAHGLYAEGLRTYYRDGDYRAAARLFQAALEQDSTFATAAYYLGRSEESLDPSEGAEAYARAARLAAHATEREALLIRVQWPAAQNEPGWIALAESLATRYPDEPESHYAQGLARSMAGEFAGSMRAFRAAIRLDSLSLHVNDARCTACDAYEHLVEVDIGADSMNAALRDAAAWLRAQPHSARAWELWADALERHERLAEALAARDSADRLRTGDGAMPVDRAYYLIRGGDLRGAERLLGAAEDAGAPDARLEAMWWHIVELRYAGRPMAAAELARRFRASAGGSLGGLNGIPLGAALFEAGDYPAAARVFDSAGVHTPQFRREHPGIAGRHRAWALAQRATVAAAALDTARLRVLADSVEREAGASAYGRDHMLATYVRGLRLEQTGRLPAAADSFRAAIFSPTDGYTRVNFELARTLLALDRPRAAIPWLQAVLRGGIEASNYFLTRPDAEELLARCFAAAGEPDSAHAYYRRLAHSWAHAEPAFLTRLARTRSYLAEQELALGSKPHAPPARR